MPMWISRGTSVPLSEEQLKGLLKKYDTNGDGKLSRKELKAAFKSLGLHFSSWRARRAFRHADANGDGFINEEEMNELVKFASKWGFTIGKEEDNGGEEAAKMVDADDDDNGEVIRLSKKKPGQTRTTARMMLSSDVAQLDFVNGDEKGGLGC
ncbi:probable calcium-binding protein CML10 [Cornus florida]|uniref:probable calcium-binding protein CML10 n=1 Tax=Cornus florida TaxID=4283 RepID=UPI00289DD745|nr:probable calcium-binding protein CML10 [Cornus florida]